MEEEEESSVGGEAPRAGDGWLGAGPPLQVMRQGAARDLCDGASLCSPSRWPLERRRFPANALWLDVRQRILEFARSVASPQLFEALTSKSICPKEEMPSIFSIASRERKPAYHDWDFFFLAALFLT